MNFSSDNAYGVAPEILAALAAANTAAMTSYGGDPITAKLQDSFSRLFEREVVVFPLATGTAANALALATLVPQHGAIFCHAQSHIAVDECGAPEFYSHGAKLIGIEGAHAKLTPAALESAIARLPVGDVHSVQPSAISITQATERGAVYSRDELAAIAQVAKTHQLKLHMDGARFANALVHLGCAPADITWRAGVDVLSFGATKNGALGAEAVIFFDPKLAGDFAYRRKRGGHLLSKMRFVSAQLDAYLSNDLWLKQAARANALAAQLADGLQSVQGIEITTPVQANAVFVRLPKDTIKRLRTAGAQFYEWEKLQDGAAIARLVTSFATPQSDIARFIDIAKA